MFDATFPEMLPPKKCTQGCANWADLAGDGNTRSQSAVDAKWSNGVIQADAGRRCAMPGNDPDVTYWCYCRGSQDSTWGYCQSSTTPVVEQLNLQFAKRSLLVASFVTFGETTTDAPMAEYSLTASMDSAQTATGVTQVYQAPYNKKYHFHFVKLAGLRAGAKYYYRVKSAGSDWSHVHSFDVINHDGPTTAAIFGDMGVYSYNNMGNLQDDIRNERIQSVIHLGDHAYNLAKNDGGRGDGYMNAFSKLLSNFSWIPVLGNHEFYGDIADAERYANMTYDHDDDGTSCALGGDACSAHAHNVARPVNALLAMGSALGAGMHGGGRLGTSSKSSRYYSVDLGLIHFVSLDLNAYYFNSDAQWREPQLSWLRRDLEAAHANRAAVPWIVVGSHYPMYCTSNSLATGAHDDGQDPSEIEDTWTQDCWSYGGKIQQVRDDLEPLYAEFGVDIYFAGHEHNYESTWPVLNSTLPSGESFENPKAPVHFTTGAGGAPGLDTFGATASFIRKRLSAWGYGIITAHNATHFTYDHFTNADGALYDSVTVVKDVHEPYRMPARMAVDGGVLV